jgi:signal transduction histidine kinase/CheY-like chemotaxis protein
MLGYTKDELHKLNLKDLLQIDNQDQILSNIDRLIHRASGVSEMILVRKDRSHFAAAVSVKILPNGQMQGVIRDISERQKFENELIASKEKAEENDRLKTAFLQNMSHEIRTPMNAIMGFADLLPEYFYDEEKLIKYAGIIKEKGADLLEIINDILNIARIESGQMQSNPENCKMSTFFAEMETLFHEYQIRQNKCELEFQLKVAPEVNPLEVYIDQAKLKQILMNLVRNAFKFTSAGTIKVGCSITGNNELYFYVSDTGIGIEKAKHSEIFRPFQQANRDNTQILGGTGLGLSIVHGFLDLMGGKIWLESEINDGCTFCFTLPFILSEKPVEVQVIRQVELLVEPQNALVLIVENDEYSAEYLKEILSEIGLSYLHTQSGRSAVDICSKQKIQLVLMDIRLPDMTGYEATRLIKSADSEVKVIVQTAYSTLEDKRKALDAGCDEYISKPIKHDLLVSIINFYLKNQKSKVQS